MKVDVSRSGAAWGDRYDGPVADEVNGKVVLEGTKHLGTRSGTILYGPGKATK